MRPIDADELKTKVLKEGTSYILTIIDNAQTIEPEITNDDLQAAMTESYRLGYELAEIKFKRPHGKWLSNCRVNGVNFGRSCSLCGKVVEFSENYCPNCGADMRGDNNVDK